LVGKRAKAMAQGLDWLRDSKTNVDDPDFLSIDDPTPNTFLSMAGNEGCNYFRRKAKAMSVAINLLHQRSCDDFTNHDDPQVEAFAKLAGIVVPKPKFTASFTSDALDWFRYKSIDFVGIDDKTLKIKH
jgi:hypothetical protein